MKPPNVTGGGEIFHQPLYCGGDEYDLGFAKAFAETKFTIIDDSQLAIGGGLGFRS